MVEERSASSLLEWGRRGRRLPAAPLTLALIAGAAFSIQAFMNGRLATSVGSVELAAGVNNVVGLALLIVLAGVSRALIRALRRLRAGARLRWWHLLAGVNGAIVVLVGAAAAPRVGVALLTVAAVCGQLLGGLVVDRCGLGPAGRRRFTVPRLLGVAIALAAVALGALHSETHFRIGLLAAAMVAGAGVAIQQAAMGHVARATGEPLAAATLNVAVATVVSLTIWIAATGSAAPDGWAASPAEWIGGGVCAVAALTIISNVVSTLGVLRLMLALVAGQSVGALVIDLIAPAAGASVTVLTVVSVVLTFAAVVVTELRAPQRKADRHCPDSATAP